MENKKKKFFEALRPEYLFWCAFLFLFFSWINFSGADMGKTAGLNSASPSFARSNFIAPDIEATSATVYDIKADKFLFEKNAKKILPLASLTKIMTARVSLLLAPETLLVTIDNESIKKEGDSGLIEGERWILRDLLRFLLTVSSNDAAAAVAVTTGLIGAETDDIDIGHRFFIDKMNEEALSLELPSLRFYNESGLDIDEESAGAVGSASDIARLFSKVFVETPHIFASTNGNMATIFDNNGLPREIANTNRSTSDFPLLLASKTGYTDLAGGNLAVIFDAGFNHPIAIIVLGSTEKGRFEDAKKLVWATLDFFHNNQ